MQQAESRLYSADAKLLCEIIKADWAIGLDNPLNIEFETEQQMVNSRVGNIFVYQVHRTNEIGTTDYRTLNRVSKLAIKVSTRFWKNHMEWCDEVYRILMQNRRLGKGKFNLGNYIYIEIPTETTYQDLSGWWCTTFDVKLVASHVPLYTDGFGDEFNKDAKEYTGQ